MNGNIGMAMIRHYAITQGAELRDRLLLRGWSRKRAERFAKAKERRLMNGKRKH